MTTNPSELAKQLAQATLNYKGPDNGAKAGEINHDTERMTAAIFNVIRHIQGRSGTLDYTDITLLHLIHGFGRCITKIKERGEIPWDKVADHAGWLCVYRNAYSTQTKGPDACADVPPSGPAYSPDCGDGLERMHTDYSVLGCWNASPT